MSRCWQFPRLLSILFSIFGVCSSLSCSRSTSQAIQRREVLSNSLCIAVSTLAPTLPAQAAYIDPTTDPLTITSRIYFEIILKPDTPPSRLVIGIYGDAVPRLAAQMVSLAASNAYAGSTFYRILDDFTVQGGAIGDETGKTSTAPLVVPDNYNLRHTIKGLVSAVRTRNGDADSRFFIQCVDDAGWADDRYAVFGKVLEGYETLVVPMQKVAVEKPANRPKVPVTIVASGVVK